MTPAPHPIHTCGVSGVVLLVLAALAFCAPRADAAAPAAAADATSSATLRVADVLTSASVANRPIIHMFRGVVRAIDSNNQVLELREPGNSPYASKLTAPVTGQTIVVIDGINSDLRAVQVGDVATVRYLVDSFEGVKLLSIRILRELRPAMPPGLAPPDPGSSKPAVSG